MMKRKAYVYWIHLDEHDISTGGYVGVSYRPERRWDEHRGFTRRGVHKNSKLANAIRKHGDNVRFSLMMRGSESYCYEVERQFRPEPMIGWNLAIGGDHPNSGPKSEETKRRMRKPKNVKRAKGTQWWHDPVTDRSGYFMMGNEPNGWVKGRAAMKPRRLKEKIERQKRSRAGYKHAEETIEKMRESGKKRYENNPSAMIGRHWYHDPVTKYSSFFFPSEVPAGWILGRYSRTKVIQCAP